MVVRKRRGKSSDQQLRSWIGMARATKDDWDQKSGGGLRYGDCIEMQTETDRLLGLADRIDRELYELAMERGSSVFRTGPGGISLRINGIDPFDDPDRTPEEQMRLDLEVSFREYVREMSKIHASCRQMALQFTRGGG